MATPKQDSWTHETLGADPLQYQQGADGAGAAVGNFAIEYGPKLATRVAGIKDVAKQFIALSDEISKKGHHWLSANDTDLLATAKVINDSGKALTNLATQIDSWAGSPNKDSIAKGSQAEKYVDNLLAAADFVIAAKNANLAVDNMNKATSEDAVNAWADSVCDVFDKAGGLIGMIPSDGLPGFITDYYKGLFSAPRNYVTAFRKIMKEHYARIDDEGHVPDPDKEQAYDLLAAKTVWKGELSGLYVGAAFRPKAKDGQALQDFMLKHRNEDGLDLFKAHLEAGKYALRSKVEALLEGDDPARDDWMAYFS
jgi:hypothetical protein